MKTGNLTYVIAILIMLYAIAFRGLGANDWNTAIIMISVALVGMGLHYDHDKMIGK